MAAIKNVVNVVKKNPKKTALFVAVGIIGIVFVARRGGSASNEEQTMGDGFTYGTGQYTSEMMAYGVQMAQIQGGITQQSNQLQAQLSAIDATNAHALEIAQLDQHTKEMGITTAYNIAMLESAERVHGLDQAADIARLSAMNDYSLKDKALNYQNENAIAQNAIIQSQLNMSHEENMTYLGIGRYVAESDAGYNLAALAAQERMTAVIVKGQVDVSKNMFNAAASAAISDAMGGALSTIFGTANMARMNQSATSYGNYQTGKNTDKSGGTVTTSTGGGGSSNSKSGSGDGGGGFMGWF